MPPRIRRRITSSKKEEIEKEQELLSKSIVRPFDVLNNLPVSYSLPNIEVLKQPLTVKDSGVLYRSLLKSRTTYLTSCPMFQLYWVKQSSYIRKLMDEGKPIPKHLKRDDTLSERKTVLGNEVNARDIMVKLLDCGLSIGPHSFDVRIFIAKDSRSDTKEDKIQKKKEKEEKKRQRQEEKAIMEEERKQRKIEKEKEKFEKEKEKIKIQEQKRREEERRQSDPKKKTTKKQGEKKQTKNCKKSSNMQTDENQIMINNLNYIASLKSSLNELMKVVAHGEADSQQILEFQQYIKLAKDLGPPPHKDEEIVVYLENMNNPTPIKIEIPPPLSKEKKPPKEKKVKPPKEIIPRDKKLTAFQELYSHDATLLFEFVENSNTRFQIPKNSICEVLEPSTMINADDGDVSDNKDILISFLWIHNQEEVNEYERKLEEYNEIKEEEKRKEEEKIKEEEEKKANEEKEKNEEEKPNENDKIEEDKPEESENKEEEDPDAVEVKHEEEQSTDVRSEEQEPIENKEEEPKRRFGRGRKKKRGPPPRKPATPKEIQPPTEPEIRFTSVSFSLHGIPTKLLPIFLNSVKPLEEVQSYMKHILEVGVRAPSFYLWYQVDGKLDESLAEDIRSELVSEEKRMTGIPTIQEPSEKKVYPKKKKVTTEEVENKKNKKIKIETPPPIVN
ncbi:unnamed protein product [Candida verbasci]|uniref:SWR1-complex protein 3 n=1 Tax=Candida verbasci TaxID=1227364 RepID=A0A9W4TTV6_9ASCO|nr:unnamed protein product [Candida verbasci]